jgi:hypothetical protein
MPESIYGSLIAQEWDLHLITKERYEISALGIVM